MKAEIITISIESHLEAVPFLAGAVRGVAAQAGLGNEGTDELEIAVVEAMTNVVVHANAGQPDRPVLVKLFVTPEAIEVVVHDQGPPIPADRIEAARHPPDLSAGTPPDSLAESGRGLQLIWACVDQVGYRTGPAGNALHLLKRLPPTGG